MSNIEVVFRKSRRVTLRPVLEIDVPSFVIWVNDPEVSGFMNVHMPMMEADEKEYFEQLHKRKPNEIVVAIVVDDKPIGTMGLHNIDYRNRRANTGALIGEKEFWGKGYGTEAKMLLLHYAFYSLNLRKICSNVISFNERSVQYSKKCGYTEEGRKKEHHYRHGSYWDEICLAVFKEEWEPLWQVFVKEQGDALKV